MAIVRVVFFASLRDVVGSSEMAVEADTLDALLACLGTHLSPDVIDMLRAENVRIAVNQSLVDTDSDLALQAGDEIAFLPPVTGG